ncbi:MAG TPA: YhgN family NAAT transporter [Calditrichia bacterium]|nr:YhgN family NAAT transporter [Calditrichota bacterium]HQU71559.1 YhgN family NAAT transporter [Calditrichia bacterium]HQV31165.1 YhgN family NAAT transporter [Calditrichia bacterium]
MPDLSEQIWSAAAILFLVMDPLGNIPVVLSLLKDVDEQRRRPIIIRELLIALGVLLIFLFFGQKLLNFLELQQESVSISGGIILFIIALRMIFPTRSGVMGETPDGEPFIVPLAIPLIAGPSALATLILMVRSNPERMLDWGLALLGAWALTAVIMISAPFFYRILRRRGLAAVERLMGMLLIMISVQMLINGIRQILN